MNARSFSKCRIFCVTLALALCLGPANVRAQSGAGNAISFDGTNGIVSTSLVVTNPQAFTLSVWFKTTTKNGGRLLVSVYQLDGNEWPDGILPRAFAIKWRA